MSAVSVGIGPHRGDPKPLNAFDQNDELYEAVMESIAETDQEAVFAEITPELAEMLLGRNNNYRKAVKSHIGFLDDQLSEGWDENGETIKVDRNGDVVDGQHRLNACIRTGISFRTWIIFNVDNADNVDWGRTRRLNEKLAHDGYKSVNDLSSALRALAIFEEGGNFNNSPRRQSIKSSMELLGRYPELPNIISHSHRSKPYCPHGRFAAMVAYSEGDFGEYAKYFVDGVSGKIPLDERDPVHQFREKMIFAKTRPGSRVSSQTQMALMILAWNNLLQGKSIKNLRWRPTGPKKQPFPRLLKVDEVNAR